MTNILVVENDPALRMLISQLLELEGFNVATAENGRIALEALDMQAPELVVCDLVMPEMNGCEVLKALKGNPRTAHVPLVFLTASAAPSEREKCIELGASAFMTKPFHQTELLATIRGLLPAAGISA
ncbi:response regulator transcription factor [Methylotetracoccus oryzae]|uniref:response regulator transcription factor n=1 Tax=Methylotetracoccus oryzae TaxID=1919059 RepID=UPI001118A021|nr:response regulator [Methylotetracoccus oryzae]